MAKQQWSQNSKERQRENIMNNKPWNNSSGPTSSSGKAISSQNANQGKAPLREIQKMITRIHKERLELLRWLEHNFNITIKY